METLKTSTLHLISNGLLAASLDQHLAEAVHDIADRPKVTSARKVILELHVRPADSGEDTVDAVNVQFAIDIKKPKTVIRRAMTSFPRTKSLGFETDTNKLTHAPNQRVLPMDDSDEEDE